MSTLSDNTPQSNNVQSQRGFIRVTILLVTAAMISTASFYVGRFVERRSSNVASDNAPQQAGSLSSHKRAAEDTKKCQQIVDLNSQVSKMNWELVTPFKEFEAGKIDGETLGRRTAEPEAKILRLCTRMYELANEVKDTKTRVKVVNFASAVLQRHRGFSMMIEGLATEDEIQLANGAKLFKDGRNQAMAAVIELAGSDTPQSAHLKRLLEAYEGPQE